MAVFRVEKNRGYTVMSNHHLRNAELSLKAKGLLSMMLSLPEEWNYTTSMIWQQMVKGGDTDAGGRPRQVRRSDCGRCQNE